MTNWSSRLREAMDYRSTETHQSKVAKGVSFTIRRMSFGRRLRLLSSLREFATGLEVARSGQSSEDKVEAMRCEAQMQALYLEWGLVAVHGLAIDGAEPTTDALIESGPEALCKEIAEAVHREIVLTPEERKN